MKASKTKRTYSQGRKMSKISRINMGEDTLSNGYEIYTVWLLRCRVEVLHITFVHKSILCTLVNTTETHTRVVGRCI